MKKTFICFSLFISIGLSSIGQKAGSADASFGGDGAVYYSNLHGQCNAVAVQQDAKIVVGGYSDDQINYGLLVARFKSDGSADETFGEAGKFTMKAVRGNSTYMVLAMEIDDEGKILACAKFTQTGTSNANIGLVRLMPDGTLDNSFGDSGVVIIDIERYDEIGDMMIQSDGKIIVTGNTGSRESTGNPEFLVRILSNGNRDETFGAEGLVKTTYTTAISVGAIAQQPDGKILTGSTYGISNPKFQVVRYESNGAIDLTFGESGFARLLPTVLQGGSRINDMKVQSDGKIVCTGGWAVLRFNNDGSPDSSFGDYNGYSFFKVENGYAEMKNVFVQSNKKIILTGHYQAGVGTGVGVFQYKENGLLDSSFGENGIAISGFDSLIYGTDVTTGAGAIQEDGKIVIGGTFPDNEEEFFNISLFRFHGESERNKYVQRIKKWLHRHGFTWDDWPGNNKISYYAVQRSNNSSAFTEIARLFNRNGQEKYSYEDASPLAGNNYYRLAAVSTDGSVAYSNVLAISNTNSTAIKIYPNPAKNNLQIEGLSSTQKTKLTVTDFSGNARMSAIVTGSTYNWNVSPLKQGNYILKIESNNRIVTKKFVKE